MLPTNPSIFLHASRMSSTAPASRLIESGGIEKSCRRENLLASNVILAAHQGIARKKVDLAPDDQLELLDHRDFVEQRPARFGSERREEINITVRPEVIAQIR